MHPTFKHISVQSNCLEDIVLKPKTYAAKPLALNLPLEINWGAPATRWGRARDASRARRGRGKDVPGTCRDTAGRAGDMLDTPGDALSKSEMNSKPSY